MLQYFYNSCNSYSRSLPSFFLLYSYSSRLPYFLFDKMSKVIIFLLYIYSCCLPCFFLQYICSRRLFVFCPNKISNVIISIYSCRLSPFCLHKIFNIVTLVFYPVCFYYIIILANYSVCVYYTVLQPFIGFLLLYNIFLLNMVVLVIQLLPPFICFFGFIKYQCCYNIYILLPFIFFLFL